MANKKPYSWEGKSVRVAVPRDEARCEYAQAPTTRCPKRQEFRLWVAALPDQRRGLCALHTRVIENRLRGRGVACEIDAIIKP
jgi:hypothetical protein